MKTKRLVLIGISVSTLAVLFIAWYALLGTSRRVEIGERFTIRPDESVTLKGVNLSIRLNSVVRGWYADGSGDFVYIDSTVTYDDIAQPVSLDLGEVKNVDDCAIQVISVDPYGETSCEMVVLRR